jgi:glutathione peroxidase
MVQKFKIQSLLLACVLSFFCPNQASAQEYGLENMPQYSIYQFKLTDIHGREFDFSCYEGYKILIVNTGSKCRFRGQLRELQKLYDTYKSQMFVVVAFPSNDFFFREPGSNKRIRRVYLKKYKIDFPVMAKTTVKGDQVDPIFDFLSQEQKNGRSNNPPIWNFHKYLIDSQGFLYKSLKPSTKPFDPEIVEWIKH